MRKFGRSNHQLARFGSGNLAHAAIQPQESDFPGRQEWILAWVECMPMREGGKTGWRTLDVAGDPIKDAKGRARGLPAWGLAAVSPRSNGGFTVLY